MPILRWCDGMFKSAIAFNGALGSWDMRQVVRCGAMFQGAAAFNRPLPNWNFAIIPGSVEMNNMFYSATAFNQDISSWVVTKALTQPVLFNDGTLMASNPAFQPKWGV